jgi:hypothetical protein
MADPAGASAPTEPMANLHLDEVTGERVSKSELKKRTKQRQKEEEKKAREAAAPPKPVVAKKSNAEADEKELNPNVGPYPQLQRYNGTVRLMVGYNSNISRFAPATSTSSERPSTRTHILTNST